MTIDEVIEVARRNLDAALWAWHEARVPTRANFNRIAYAQQQLKDLLERKEQKCKH